MITAIADTGKDKPAKAAAAAKAAPAKKAIKPAAKHAFRGKTVYVTMRGWHSRRDDPCAGRRQSRVAQPRQRRPHRDDAGGSRGREPRRPVSPTIKPGSAYAYVARYAGNALYVCTIHPTTMKGNRRLAAVLDSSRAPVAQLDRAADF